MGDQFEEDSERYAILLNYARGMVYGKNIEQLIELAKEYECANELVRYYEWNKRLTEKQEFLLRKILIRKIMDDEEEDSGF